MNNLKKFSTEADYSAATLNYPAVSWVTATDNVHFDKSGSTPTVNDKVMMAFSASTAGQDLVIYNASVSEPTPSQYFTSITLNDVDVMSSIVSGVLSNASEANTNYLVKYGINGTEIIDYFSGELGFKYNYVVSPIEILVPEQITVINHLPDVAAVNKLVLQSTTPPTILNSWSGDMYNIYVPDEAVNTYKSASGWSDNATYIHPISEYSGNLPV